MRRRRDEAEFARLRQTLDTCAQHIERLGEAAERWVTAVRPLAITAQDALGSAAADIEDISISIASLADSAEEAQELTQAALTQAAQGVQVVLSSGDQIQNVADTVSDSARSIKALHGKSADIVGVVAVIKDVADQTKVLALNAAIEAARAGHHGRGFAVVADAVRRLAERTAQSTREVAAIIAGIQEETTRAVDIMQTAYRQVGATSELSRKAAAALSLIHDGATRSEQTAKGIAESTRALKTTSIDIAVHIAALSQNTKHRNQAAQEALKRAHEVLAISEELKRLLQK